MPWQCPSETAIAELEFLAHYSAVGQTDAFLPQAFCFTILFPDSLNRRHLKPSLSIFAVLEKVINPLPYVCMCCSTWGHCSYTEVFLTPLLLRYYFKPV